MDGQSGTKGLDGRTIRQLLSRQSGETRGVSPTKPRRTEGLPAHRRLDQFHRGPGGSRLKRWRTSAQCTHRQKDPLHRQTTMKPSTGHPAIITKRQDELDALLYGHIPLTPKRNRWQDRHHSHAIPEWRSHSLTHPSAHSACTGLDHYLNTGYQPRRIPCLC